MNVRRATGWGILATLALCAAPAAAGSTLTMAVETETSSIDPHFQNTTGNFTVTRQIFEPLVFQDRQQHLAPGLALSTIALSEREWEVRLRPGVRFHNGAPFTSADVVFTLRRAPNVPNTPSGFDLYTRQIATVTAIDPMTVRIMTTAPDPLLPTELSTILVVPIGIEGHAETADFDDRAAAIGTGPYRFVAWHRGERVMLRRDPDYWGARPDWDDVSLTVIGNAASRVAALLARDVDMIDGVPTSAAGMLRARGDIRLEETVSSRLVFLFLDTARQVSPYVSGMDGRPLTTNPLRDRRVRRALSLAIDRGALVSRVLEGHATAAGQVMPDGFTGSDPTLAPDPFDPDTARRLLAEAGYPDGFAITLNCPANRYPGDTRLTEAVAAMWTRIGVVTRVEAQPYSSLITRLQRQDSSAVLLGWASETGESSGPLRALVATYRPDRGWGMSNRLRYANPDLDAILARALTTMDPDARVAGLRQVTELAIRDGGILPLVFLNASWALRGDLAYSANPMGYSFAFDVHPR